MFMEKSAATDFRRWCWENLVFRNSR